MSTASLNGHHDVPELDIAPAPEVALAEELERHAQELETMLPTLRVQREQLKAKLAELLAREKQVSMAIGALRGQSASAAAKPQPKPKAKAVKDWTPSEDRLRDIFEAVGKLAEPITPTRFARDSEGVGPDTAMKAFKVLRERELFRVTGSSRGGGMLYAVMPGATWPE